MPLSANKGMLFLRNMSLLRKTPCGCEAFLRIRPLEKVRFCDFKVVPAMLFFWFGLVALSTCHEVEDADKVGNINNTIAVDVGKGIGVTL